MSTSPPHSAATPTIRSLPELAPVNGNEPDDAAAGAGSVTCAAVTVNAHVWLLLLVAPTNIRLCAPTGKSEPTVN